MPTHCRGPAWGGRKRGLIPQPPAGSPEGLHERRSGTGAGGRVEGAAGARPNTKDMGHTGPLWQTLLLGLLTRLLEGQNNPKTGSKRAGAFLVLLKIFNVGRLCGNTFLSFGVLKRSVDLDRSGGDQQTIRGLLSTIVPGPLGVPPKKAEHTVQDRQATGNSDGSPIVTTSV